MDRETRVLADPPFNFNQLRLFLAVAETGGVTRAAEAIAISQPAISRAIHELEREVGVPLLERVGRQVVLTEAGQLLADYGRRVFALADEGRHALDELRGLARGRLAVGASTTIGIYLLPRLAGQFHAQHPGIELSLDVGNTEHVLTRLRSGRLDLAFVEGTVDDPDLTAERYLHDQLVLIAAPDHRLAQAGQATARDLATTPFLMREPGSGTRQIVSVALAAHNIEPPVAMDLGHTEAIKQAVAAGLGVSILSRLTIEYELALGLLAIVPITGLTIDRWFLLTQRRHSRPSMAAQAFLALVQARTASNGEYGKYGKGEMS